MVFQLFLKSLRKPSMPYLRSTILAVLSALSLAACVTAPPQGLQPVSPFDIQRYLGQWYEIARLDHSFERGMSDVNATYQLAADGSVRVINRGYDVQRQAWKEAIGRAVFIGSSAFSGFGRHSASPSGTTPTTFPTMASNRSASSAASRPPAR